MLFAADHSLPHCRKKGKSGEREREREREMKERCKSRYLLITFKDDMGIIIIPMIVRLCLVFFLASE
jgi:hypothetical protein